MLNHNEMGVLIDGTMQTLKGLGKMTRVLREVNKQFPKNLRIPLTILDPIAVMTSGTLAVPMGRGMECVEKILDLSDVRVGIITSLRVGEGSLDPEFIRKSGKSEEAFKLMVQALKRAVGDGGDVYVTFVESNEPDDETTQNVVASMMAGRDIRGLAILHTDNVYGV